MASSQTFLHPQTLAKLQGLELRTRSIVEGYVSGVHKSPFHGFSIEFAEHREYAPGDDLRYVDWKVFGRTDKVYLKQYEEETNLIAHMVLDTSKSMQYQSDPKGLSKLEYAQCVIASLSHLVLQQQDAVGLVTFDEKVKHFVRSSSNPSHIKSLLHVLEEVDPIDKTATGPIFHDLSERLKKRGLVLIFSDLFDDVQSMMAGLKHLKHRRNDVIVFHVLDPAELDFPFRRATKFQGMEEIIELQADPRSIRDAYLEEFNRFRTQVEKGCHQIKADYVLMRTDLPIDLSLSSYLSDRMLHRQ